MSIELSLEDIFLELSDDLDKISMDKVPVITRQALNRTLTATRSQFEKRVRSKLNLKLRTIRKKEFTRIFNARGTDISSMSATISMSYKPISLVTFIKDAKPIEQKGIPIKKRKKLSVRVGRKRVKLKKAFVQRGKNNNLHVFKRVGKSPTYWKKQSAPSIAAIFEKENMFQPLRRFAQARFNKNFKQRLNYELSKL